jgi:hypothetical protein
MNHYNESLKEFHKIRKEILPVKISLSTRVLFIKRDEEVKYNIQSHPFNILTENKIEEVLNTSFDFVNNQIQERYFRGSGVSLKKILFMDCNIYRTKPIKGSGNYLTYCLLPFKTQSIINVQNNDNKCFLWSILSALHTPKYHVSQVGSYREYENDIKIKSFPVHINDIKKIERNNLVVNPLTKKIEKLSINVFSLTINKCKKMN